MYCERNMKGASAADKDPKTIIMQYSHGAGATRNHGVEHCCSDITKMYRFILLVTKSVTNKIC